MKNSLGEKIEDWFESGEAFEEALDAALENAEAQDDHRGTEFLEGLQQKWEAYGVRAYLSGSQHTWLMQLADL